MLELTPIITAFESHKGSSVITIYGLILEAGIIVKRKYDLDDYESPAFIVEDITKTGDSGDRGADLPFTYNDELFGAYDKSWLLNCILQKFFNQKEEALEYANSVFITVLAAYGAMNVPTVEKFLASPARCKEFKIIRNIQINNEFNNRLFAAQSKKHNKAS